MPFDLLGYREQHKGFYGDASLEEVAFDAYKRYGLDKEYDYKDWANRVGVNDAISQDKDQRRQVTLNQVREANRQDMNWMTRAGLRGIDQTQGMLYGATGMVGSLLGADNVRDWGYKHYQRNMEEASQYPGTELSDVTGAPGAMKAVKGVQWGAEKLIENIPNFAASFGTGGAAAVGIGGTKVVGSKVMQKALTGVLKKQVAKTAAKRGIAKEAAERAVLQNLAAKSGVVGVTAALEGGGMYGEGLDEGFDNPWSAAGLGIAAGFVELAGGNIRLLDKVLGKRKAGILSKALKRFKKGEDQVDTTRLIGRMVKEGARQAPGEFGQESLQEMLALANVAVNDPTFEAFTKENAARVFEAGLAGMAAGGGMGMLGGIPKPKPSTGGSEKPTTAKEVLGVDEDTTAEEILTGKRFKPHGRPSSAKESATAFHQQGSQKPAAESAEVFQKKGDLLNRQDNQRRIDEETGAYDFIESDAFQIAIGKKKSPKQKVSEKADELVKRFEKRGEPETEEPVDEKTVKTDLKALDKALKDWDLRHPNETTVALDEWVKHLKNTEYQVKDGQFKDKQEKEIPGPTPAELRAWVDVLNEQRKEDTAKTVDQGTPEFDEMVKEANRWKGAAFKADALYGEDSKARVEHSRTTGKGELDKYLIDQFGVDSATARSVSNELTHQNMKPDESAEVADFKGQSWADTALEHERVNRPAPKKAKKEKALSAYKDYLGGLSKEEKESVSDLIPEGDPAKPTVQRYKIKRALAAKAKKTAAEKAKKPEKVGTNYKGREVGEDKEGHRYVIEHSSGGTPVKMQAPRKVVPGGKAAPDTPQQLYDDNRLQYLTKDEIAKFDKAATPKGWTYKRENDWSIDFVDETGRFKVRDEGGAIYAFDGKKEIYSGYSKQKAGWEIKKLKDNEKGEFEGTILPKKQWIINQPAYTNAVKNSDATAVQLEYDKLAKKHEALVTTVFAKGRKIPEYVLKDYPNLKAIKEASDKGKAAPKVEKEPTKQAKKDLTNNKNGNKGEAGGKPPTKEGGKDGKDDSVTTGGQSVPALEKIPSKDGQRAGKGRKTEGSAGSQRQDSRGRDVRDKASDDEELPDSKKLSAKLSERISNEERQRGDSTAEVYTPSRRRSRDHRITPADQVGEGGRITKARQNVEAIRTLKIIEAEQRDATKAEKSVLVKYVGWGGLPQVFDRAYNINYETAQSLIEVGNELEEILTEEELKNAKASTTNAHYTAPAVIQAMWKMATRLGFKGGKVLEPGSGVGHFKGLMPKNLVSKTNYIGIELDSISARISRLLYPDSTFEHEGFESVEYPDNHFDVAISNVPFADVRPYDPSGKYDKYKFYLHDFFFAKALDKVRPGGLVMFITSKGTMDKKSKIFRKYIAGKADLVASVRLPEDAFRKNAMTDVVTDIVILRKHDPNNPFKRGQKFENLKEIDTEYGKIPVNEYYADHPDMLLGKMSMTGSMYRSDSVTMESDGRDLEGALKDVINRLPKSIMKPVKPKKVKDESPPETILAPKELKEGNLVYQNTQIMKKRSGELVPTEIPRSQVSKVRAMIELRDNFRDVIKSQTEGRSEGTVKLNIRKLNKTYDAFVKKHGFLNARKNNKVFREDPEASRVYALEAWNEDKQTAEKAEVFERPVVQRPQPVTSAPDAQSALKVVLNELGKPDVPRMAELTGQTEADIINELKDVLYLNPETNEWETSETYLAGNVKYKLRVAKQAAKGNPDLHKNVEALEAVQPKPLKAIDVEAKLGSAWIPRDIIKGFVDHILGTEGYNNKGAEIRHSEHIGTWVVVPSFEQKNRPANTDQWGTSGMYAHELIQYALNQKVPIVRVWDSALEKTVVSPEQTELAGQKMAELKTEFSDWIYKESDRRKKIEQLYNDKFNNDVDPKYNGEHLTLPGSNKNIELYPTQKNAIWRIINEGKALLHHVVGAGKTWTMVGAGMELKRLGIINKPLYVLPNHMVEQFEKEFLELYPAANILTVGPEDVTKTKRQATTARIATRNLDAVLMRQSTYSRLGVTPERERAFIQKEVDELEWALVELKSQEKSQMGRSLVKQIQKAIAKKKEKLKKLANRKAKDTHMYFEELGVDWLMVDEAHGFKNLEFHTKIQVSGLGARSNVQKTLDMKMKTEYMQELHGDDKGVVFATGTPISNSIAEMFIMLKYLAPTELSKLGLSHFDSWAGTFAEATSEHEWAIDNTGYVERTRFRKFVNIGDLMTYYRKFADIIMPEDLPEQIKLPKVRGGNPETILIPASDDLLALNQELAWMLAQWKKNRLDYPQGNPLNITGIGKKAALDMRLIDPSMPDDPNSKINTAVKNIHKIWKSTEKNRSTQLVWINSGTPGGSAKIDLYTDIKKKLMSQGIPEKEIALIHSYPTPAKRLDLFQQVRLGNVRVLIGSTSKMGTGMNVQTKLVAAHHLEPDWRPADIEQRDGRMIRQGNENSEVQMYRYSTEQSFDTFFWQTLETKSGYIGQVLKSGRSDRFAEDIDKISADFAEAMAVTSGNPLVKEKIVTDAKVRKLQLLQRAYRNQFYKSEDELKYLSNVQIPHQKKYIANLKADLTTRTDTKGDKFTIKIGKKTFTERKDASKVLSRQVSKLSAAVKTGAKRTIGGFAGFPLQFGMDSRGYPTFILQGKNSYEISPFERKKSFITLESGHRVESWSGEVAQKQNMATTLSRGISRLENEIENYEALLKKNRETVEGLKKAVGQKFTKETELQEALARQAELHSILSQQAEQETTERQADEGPRRRYVDTPRLSGEPEGKASFAERMDKFTAAGEEFDWNHPVQKHMVQEAFPNSEIVEIDDSYMVKLPNGAIIAVIKEGREIVHALNADWREIRNAKIGDYGIISGTWKSTTSMQKFGIEGFMTLTKAATPNTVHHETFHAAKELVLTDKERAALDKKYGANEERQAVAYEKWNPKKEHGGPFRKIWNFFKRIFNAFYPNAEEVFKKIRSGEVWERPTRASESDQRLRFSMENAQDDAIDGVIKWQANQKPDTSKVEMAGSVPLYHFKKVPALKRMFDAALDWMDDKHTYFQNLIYDQNDVSRVGTLETFRKQRRDEHKRWNEYLVKRDQNAIGYTVELDKGSFILVNHRGVAVAKYGSEQEAWDAAIEFEARDYLKLSGTTQQGADALKAYRQIGHSMFAMIKASIDEIIALYESRGEALPEITQIDEDGKQIKVSLQAALIKMGDRRGYYMPRIRKPGRFVVIAKKAGANPIRKHFDLGVSDFNKNRVRSMLNSTTPMGIWARQRKKEGYKVTVKKSDALPEDLFLEVAGQQMAVEQLVNTALEKTRAGLVTDLSDIGVKIHRDEEGTLTVSGSLHKKSHGDILKSFGGEYEYVKERTRTGRIGVPTWKFTNADPRLEELLKDAIFKSEGIIPDTDTIFAGSVIQQVADLIRGHGSRSRMIARDDATGLDVWKGYEEDAILAMTRTAQGLAGGEAKKHLGRKLVNAMMGTTQSWQDFQDSHGEGAMYVDYVKQVEKERIDPGKQPNAYKEGKQFLKDIMRNDESVDRIIGTVKGIAVLKYLGFRVSAPLVNLTAMVTSVPASMSGHAKIPMTKTLGLLSRAAKTYGTYINEHRKYGADFANKTELPPDMVAALQYIEKNGWHRAQYDKEALSILKSKTGRVMDTIIDKSMLMFGATEQFNRVSTILGTYIGIKAQNPNMGMSAAMELAKETSDKSHGVYGKANLPYWARGSGTGAQVARMYYVFRTFSHNYLLNMKELGVTSKEGLFMILSPALIAGAGASVATPVLAAVARLLGEDEPEEKLYSMIADSFGDTAGDLARFGLAGMGGKGFSLKGSLSIGILDLPTSLRDVLGAPASVVTDIYQGGKNIMQGNVLKGTERILPLAAGSPLKAYREYTEGATTRSNAPLFYGNEQVKPDLVEAGLRALSFNPARIAGIKEQQWREKKVTAKYSGEKTLIYARMRKYFVQPIKDRTKADWVDIMADVKHFNQTIISKGLANQITPITPKLIKANLKRTFIPPKRERIRAAMQARRGKSVERIDRKIRRIQRDNSLQPSERQERLTNLHEQRNQLLRRAS